jgi:DNA-binding transcriptional regulator YhcF (GntR family)
MCLIFNSNVNYMSTRMRVDKPVGRLLFRELRFRERPVGALRPGEQLPGIRPLAEELVINPNTVAKVYRELEHEGVIELRHGAGACCAV